MRQAYCLAIGFGLGFGASIAIAAQLPPPEVLEQSGARPVTLRVIEPHLSEPGHPVAIVYMAFPASGVLSAALGPDWPTKAKTIEFRALDGYISRIDAVRLTSKKAYLAFARADHSSFSVDNLAQNEKKIPLGPYYLVWDNREDPELLSEGARNVARSPSRSTNTSRRFRLRPSPEGASLADGSRARRAETGGPRK